MNILAVGAHPDDLEILCGGTLAKYAKRGDKVFMAHLCNGNMGGKDIAPEELADIRDREAKNSAAIIGAEALGPVAGDLDLYPTKEMRIAVVDIIRMAKPDVIITHSVNDYMPDHVITGRLVFDAAFTATLPLYKTKLPAHEKIMPIYYMETLAGFGFEPSHYVDITEFMAIKKKMLLAHESQYKWLSGHHQAEPVKMLEKVAGFRGVQCGVEYAEAFSMARVWGRISMESLLP
ncbi:MAG: PIG-L family deacetylase [Candidatus Omnitrophica bacterium]|nr:PIG-L family deacetylase [Candidatus Omnitrophota bacterium]